MTRRYLVWDRFVRTFHWTLAAAFFIAYFTGDEESRVHVYAGYLIGALVLARLLWGLMGSRHARFTDFVRGPRAVAAYLRGFVRGPVQHYRGHNPAGGWMVLALLASLAVTVATGIEVYGLEGRGPLAAPPRTAAPAVRGGDHDDEQTEEHGRGEAAEEWWEEIHEAAANVTLALVGLHLLGVVVSSVRHRENLVRAMITGYKSEPPR